MLGLRDLNRTLLARQHLLQRATMPVLEMLRHLLGLQAQDPLPPYLGLAARLEDFDPYEVSAALESAAAVRLVSLRATIHLHDASDALQLRAWVQPSLDRMSSANQANLPARHLPVDEVVAATEAVLAGGALPVKELGERLADRFPGVPGTALAHVARERLALVQVPPRGLWGRSGGVVYQHARTWLGGPAENADPRDLVRRYLAAFGPATAADMTAWSRVTRLGPVFAAMSDELEVVECHDGRPRFDLPGAPYVDGDAPAPVRLLGTYDNLWLGHADRTHVMDDDARRLWTAANGGAGHVVLVDGFVAGLWRWADGRIETETLRRLSRPQRSELDEEIERTTALLRR